MSFEAALAEILERYAGGRDTAGLAMITGGGAATAWAPKSAPEESAYLAYSITKTFIASLVLMLRDEGRLSLDDRLARWLPGLAEAERISLRRLLDHTAGVPDYGGLSAYHEDLRASPTAPWSFERYMAETLEKGLSFEPGNGWAYSNPGYMLLRRIAEEAAGRRFAELIAERIARPLGLARTFVAESLEDLASLAPAMSQALSPDGTPRDVRSVYHPGWVSHGVVASTPSEIARFFDALARGRVISPASVQEMTVAMPVPAAAGPWGRPGYGLGVMVDAASRWGLVWGHNGSGPGYSASALHAPSLGQASVCAMCAFEEGPPAEQLVFAALDVLRGV